MNSFRAPGMSQILGVELRWRQDKIRRTQNPNIQRERSYPQNQARVCVVGGKNKVRADLNPLRQPSSGSGPQGSLPGIQSPGLPGTVLPPGPNPWKYHMPSTMSGSALPTLADLASFSPSSAPFRWGSQFWRPRSWWESTLTPMWPCE